MIKWKAHSIVFGHRLQWLILKENIARLLFYLIGDGK